MGKCLTGLAGALSILVPTHHAQAATFPLNLEQVALASDIIAVVNVDYTETVAEPQGFDPKLVDGLYNRRSAFEFVELLWNPRRTGLQRTAVQLAWEQGNFCNSVRLLSGRYLAFLKAVGQNEWVLRAAYEISSKQTVVGFRGHGPDAKTQQDPPLKEAKDEIRLRLIADEPTDRALRAGVGRGLPSLMPCFQQARARGDLGAGKHEVSFEWDILPNGSVSKARVTAPQSVVDGKLAECVVQTVDTWQFLPSTQGLHGAAYTAAFQM